MAFSTSRLIHRSLFNVSLWKKTPPLVPLATNRKITVVPISEEEARRKQKNQKLPISPHVTIYKFPLPAMTSITHRFTGIGLTAGFNNL